MDLNTIQELAAQKENEWKITTAMQIKSLQDALSTETKDHTSLKCKFSELKDDFKYNLQVLYNGFIFCTISSA